MNTNAFSDHGSWVRRPRADRLNNYISGVQLVLQKTRSNYLRNTDKIRSIHGISRKIANFYNTSAGARIPTALEGEALLGFHQFTERFSFPNHQGRPSINSATLLATLRCSSLAWTFSVSSSSLKASTRVLKSSSSSISPGFTPT